MDPITLALVATQLGRAKTKQGRQAAASAILQADQAGFLQGMGRLGFDAAVYGAGASLLKQSFLQGMGRLGFDAAV